MQRVKNIILFLICVLFIVTGCTSRASKKVMNTTASQNFTIPKIPAVLISPQQKAEFVLTHYWDNYNFADTTLISRADYTEQAFVDFVNLLPNVPMLLATQGIDTMMRRAEADSAMYACFMSMSEKYLYDPNSPFRNEELYVVVLRNIVSNNRLSEIDKMRPQFQLDLALKNRVGELATDFEYTTLGGRKSTLYGAKGDKLLIFFFYPDCETCKEVKEYVVNKGIDKLVNIVWVNPELDSHLDSIYNLRASPTLYLLDKDKRVLLKDASIEQIENYLTDPNHE